MVNKQLKRFFSVFIIISFVNSWIIDSGYSFVKYSYRGTETISVLKIITENNAHIFLLSNFSNKEITKSKIKIGLNKIILLNFNILFRKYETKPKLVEKNKKIEIKNQTKNIFIDWLRSPYYLIEKIKIDKKQRNKYSIIHKKNNKDKNKNKINRTEIKTRSKTKKRRKTEIRSYGGCGEEVEIIKNNMEIKKGNLDEKIQIPFFIL